MTESQRSSHEIPVVPPYRLDLTANVLRRLSNNLVDVFTATGEYRRALSDASNTGKPPTLIRVRQLRADSLTVTTERDGCEPDARDHVVRTVSRMLGADRDLSHFDEAASGISWLRPLALRMKGVRPPRYPTLWEACVNAIVFQQVSLLAASAIIGRLVAALASPLAGVSNPQYTFPEIMSFASASDGALRAAGLSQSKLATLRRVSEAIADGTLDEQRLEELPSSDASATLREIKGIGPWSAALILLRGLGRLDVFPVNDTSVARNLGLVAADTPIDLDSVVHALSPQQGMLYYHLLLARLERRGALRTGDAGDRTRQ